MADFAGLETILDRARAALVAGDIASLDGMAADAEVALATAGHCDRAAAERIAAKAQRNEHLIAEAMKGIRAAQRRARDLTDHGRFSTYDSDGRRGQPGLSLQGFAARRL